MTMVSARRLKRNATIWLARQWIARREPRALSVVAALYPARFAARMVPADALRSNV